MNVDNFIVRPHRKLVEQFSKADAWGGLGVSGMGALSHSLACLPNELESEDEDAKRFDLLMLKLQLAQKRELAGAFGPETHAPSPPRGRIAELSARGVEPAPLDAIEREHILDVLRQVNGNRMAAAKLLGISRRALYRRLDRHHLGDEAPPPAARRAS